MTRIIRKGKLFAIFIISKAVLTAHVNKAILGKEYRFSQLPIKFIDLYNFITYQAIQQMRLKEKFHHCWWITMTRKYLSVHVYVPKFVPLFHISHAKRWWWYIITCKINSKSYSYDTSITSNADHKGYSASDVCQYSFSFLI